MKTVLIILLILISLVSTANSNIMIERAKPYKPVMEDILLKYWADMPDKSIIYGEVEQESGWKSKAHLHTSREDGYSLAQITIAYDSNGKVRFNNFLNAVQLEPLKKWDWKTDPYNERFQLTYLVLQLKSNFATNRRIMKNDQEAINSTLVSYNAGYGRVLKRRSNAVIMGNDKTAWVNGLDKSYGKGEMTLLYGRPLWQAVNEYPIVIRKKSIKYKDF